MHQSVAVQGPLICNICGEESDPLFNDGATLRCSACEVEFVQSSVFSECFATLAYWCFVIVFIAIVLAGAMLFGC